MDGRLRIIESHHFELGYDRLHGRRWMGRSIVQRIAESSTNPPTIQQAPKFNRPQTVSGHSVGSVYQGGGFGRLPREGVLMSKNTLIIDDDEMSRRLLRLVLEYDGCRCVEAENGAIGLSLIESQPFDIIILDNAMPVMTGMEFLNRLQLRPQSPYVPVIMVTGLLNAEIREKAIRLGVYAILGKPYDFGELRSMVAQLLCP